MYEAENKTLANLHGEAGLQLSEAFIEGCELTNCDIVAPLDPLQRPILRKITFRSNLVDQGCRLRGAVLEDCLIQDIRSYGKLIVVAGCAFKRVTFRGFFDKLNIVPQLVGFDDRLAEYEVANRAYYGRFEPDDWAIDISEAVGDFSLRGGIPSRLIRINPDFQGVMSFDDALLGEWRSVPGVRESGLLVDIEELLLGGFGDIVISVPRSRGGEAATPVGQSVLRELRQRGIIH